MSRSIGLTTRNPGFVQPMKSLNMQGKQDRFMGELILLPGSHRALFGEALYHIDGLDYSLSTQLRRE